MGPLLSLLQLCKKPFEKELSSDENVHVPNLPIFLNALCNLIRCGELPQKDPSSATPNPELDPNSEEFDNDVLIIQATSVVSNIASDGVRDIKEMEESLAQKKIFGNKHSPLMRLYLNGLNFC